MEIKNWWYRISVKALIYNEEWKLLLCKESNATWDLPGGGLDHGEYAIDCLARELYEEMWLEVESIDPVPKVFVATHKPKSISRPWISNICYVVHVKDFNFIPSEECVEIGFFALEELSNINVLVNVKEVGKELIKLRK